MAEKNDQTKKAPAKGKTTGKQSATAGGKKKAPSKKTDEVKTKIQELETRYQDINDKYLRLSAEFDNFRKRTLKEKADLTKFAGEDLLVSLLPVMDDFDRALQSMDSAENMESLKEGIMLIYNKFSEFFKQRGIQEIESKNKAFDTDLHEAITKIPAPEKKLKGKVVDVIEKGYALNGKVVRYSKVVVGD